MNATVWVALAGVLVSLVIGLATAVLQRRASAAQTELSLIDQLQEERTNEFNRRKSAEQERDDMRTHLNDALDRIDQLLATIRDQSRRIADLESQLPHP